jgi:hypothetical protein
MFYFQFGTFFIFRLRFLDVHLTPRDVYIYPDQFLCSFSWFLWNRQRWKYIIFLSSFDLITVVFFKNCRPLGRNVQFDDNWSSTSTNTNIVLKQDKILLTRKRLLTDKNIRNVLAWPWYSHLSKYMYGFIGKFNVKKNN